MSSPLLIQRVKQRGIQQKTGQNASVHKTVKAGSLLTIARSPLVRQLLYDASTVIGHISIEASQLAHIHIMRCAERDLPLPDLSGNDFWYPVYTCIQKLRYGRGVVDSCGDELLLETAKLYAAEIAPPALPVDSHGNEIAWRDGAQNWKMDLLKAAAAKHSVNATELWTTNVRAALGKLVGSLMSSIDEIPVEIRLSLRAAILSSLWDRTSLDEVSKRFKRLKALGESFFSDTEQLINTWDVRWLVPDAGEKNLGNIAKKLYFIRRRLIELHPLTEAAQFQQQQPPLESTLPFTRLPSDKLVLWLQKSVEDGLTRKIYKRCICRVLDFLRIHKGGYFREPEDLSFPRQRGTRCRSYEIQRAMLNAIYGKPLQLFSENSMNPADIEWVESTVRQLQTGLVDPFNAEDAGEHVRNCLIPLVHGKMLRSRWKRAKKGKETAVPPKRPKIPALSPLSKKRAPHVILTAVSVKKLASVVSERDGEVAKTLKLKLIELKNAEKARVTATKAIDTSSLGDFMVDEDMERQYQANVAAFNQNRSETSKKRYRPKDEEAAYLRAKNKAIKLSDDVAALGRSKDAVEMEYQSAVWNALFRIKPGRNGWSFDGRLTTDGIDTSLAYIRRKTPEENAAEEAATVSGKSKTTLKKDAKSVRNAVAWRRAGELATDPTAPSPRVFDPGMDGHMGVIIDDECFQRLGEVNNKHFQLIRLDKTWMDRLSGIKKATSTINEWREINDAVRKFETDAPSHKVATLEEFDGYCQRTNQALHGLYGFYTQNCVRRLRFMRVCRQQAMLESALEKICGTKDREQQKKTVVVFGDASINSGKCGKAKVCHGELVGFLEKRCCLVRIDEYRSSQRCCCCHAQLEEPLVCEGSTSTKSWKRRVCVNASCNRLFWQRDVNACINLAQFFLWKLHGQEFPACFNRAKVIEEEDLTGGSLFDVVYITNPRGVLKTH